MGDDFGLGVAEVRNCVDALGKRVDEVGDECHESGEWGDGFGGVVAGFGCGVDVLGTGVGVERLGFEEFCQAIREDHYVSVPNAPASHPRDTQVVDGAADGDVGRVVAWERVVCRSI